VQEFVLYVWGDLLRVLHCTRRMPCVSIKLVVLIVKMAPMASHASREGGRRVVGWQDLKMESGDIVDLTPRAREDPPALRTTPF
jgi:hypothetical protein